MVVDHKQTLADVAVHRLGDATGMFALALLNNISLSEDVKPGAALALPVAVNSKVVTYFSSKNAVPATADEERSDIFNSGISVWAINVDFVVSPD